MKSEMVLRLEVAMQVRMILQCNIILLMIYDNISNRKRKLYNLVSNILHVHVLRYIL